ncbi:MAG: hypothetical protein AB1601_10830 [Planctomycetota bacterium]
MAGSLARARRDMSSQARTPESESYLFVIGDGREDVSHNTVFHRAADAELAASICRLCEREYGGEVRFSHRLSSSFSPDDQVLLDEALDELIIYDDPDPGIYDPPPTRQTLFRAQCARRCQRWEEMLRNRRTPERAPAQPAPRPRSAGSSESSECRLTDDDLLKICGIGHDDTELTPEHIAELHRVACLIGPRYVGTGASLELALSLLASVLGSFPRHNPTHLPFGYQGPTIKSHGWLDCDILERTGKQIVGLLWADCAPDTVALRVEHAISEAVRLGFLEETRYDAWRPGMPSGSGWRVALAATTYGVAKARPATAPTAADDHVTAGQRDAAAGPIPDGKRIPETSTDAAKSSDVPCPEGQSGETLSEPPPEVAEFLGQLQRLTATEQAHVLRLQLFLYAQAYHNLVEAVANSPIGWVDTELNGWYLQIIKVIQNLLALPEFADFPGGFEPVAPNLFPCSDLDVGWEDCIGPPVMDFLGRAQAFMLNSGPVTPENQDFVNNLVAICRDKCVQASEVAARFRQRADATFKKMLDRAGQRAGDSHTAAPPTGTKVPEKHEGSAPALDPTTARNDQGQATSALSSDDRYEWARQIDLVRATNQVLGEGMLNKGVLSRACADGQVETNGKAGRGARVRVRSFLTWVSRQNQLGADEATQIRNAVIGELSSRNL